MQIGISTASFFTKERTENTFQIIDDMGINICEVFLTTFREYKKDFIKELIKRKGNIKVYSVHSLNVQYEHELFNPVDRTREDCEYFFKEVGSAAGMLGADFYTFHGLALMKRTPYTINYKMVGERINELNKMLYEVGNGCRLAYENVHWTLFNFPDYYNNLKKYTNVNTCLDIKQAMQSKYSVYDYIDAMGEKLVNVHLCDFDDNGNLFVPGKGTFDFTKLFKVLLDNGYNGPLIMELYAGNYKSYDEILEGYEYLCNCLEKAKI